MRAWVIAALIVCAAAAPARAADAPRSSPLRSYLAKVRPQIKTYISLGKRASRVFDDPDENASAIAQGLSDISDRFGRLAVRWDRVEAPPGLGLKHRGMGGALHLQARFFAMFADAWSQYAVTGDQSFITDLTERTAGLGRSISYLQRRWALALTGALLRAALPVPHWLEQMAMSRP